MSYDPGGSQLPPGAWQYGSEFAPVADDTANHEVRDLQAIGDAPSYTPSTSEWEDVWGDTTPPPPIVAGPFAAGVYLINKNIYMETAASTPAGSARLVSNTGTTFPSNVTAALVDGVFEPAWDHIVLTEETWFYLDLRYTANAGTSALVEFTVIRIA